jgi:hypothetical protein
VRKLECRVKLSGLLSRHRVLERLGGGDAAATTTAVLFAERAARSASVATSSLGEPAPFLGMVSQPCLGSDQLIPMKINRVRDPKTRLRADRIAFVHFCKFAHFDPAIREKPDKNFPACWTVV